MFNDLVNALSEYKVILEPDKNIPQWWAGAPSVTVSGNGTFYLAARMREGDSERGKRGYEIRILKSDDGCNFEPINHIRREDAKLNGFERPTILIDPETDKYKLYGCSGFEKGWSILKFDDVDNPAEFDAGTAKKVLVADYPDDNFVHLYGYKDQVIIWNKGLWHMFVIGYDRIERIYHFTSKDAQQWQSAKNQGPIMENNGWHNFFTRPSSILPLAVGYLFVYEGSNLSWPDPVYNIATGLAYSPDLETFIDLTPQQPLLKSTTPGDYHSWRYSHWLSVGDKIFVYFEAARPNNTNEIRVSIIDINM